MPTWAAAISGCGWNPHQDQEGRGAAAGTTVDTPVHEGEDEGQAEAAGVVAAQCRCRRGGGCRGRECWADGTAAAGGIGDSLDESLGRDKGAGLICGRGWCGEGEGEAAATCSCWA